MSGNSFNRIGRWRETTDYTPTTDEVETAFHEFASELETAHPGTYPAPEFSDWVQAMYGFQRWMRTIQADAWDEGYRDGHNDGLSDGHPLGNDREPEENPYRKQEEA